MFDKTLLHSGLKLTITSLLLLLLFAAPRASTAASVTVVPTISNKCTSDAGSSITFGSTYSTPGCEGTGSVSYHWHWTQLDTSGNPTGILHDGGTSGTYTWTIPGGASDYQISCDLQVSPCDSSATTAKAVVHVKAPGISAIITGTPNPASTCDNVSFSVSPSENCSVSPSPTYSCVWNFNDTGSPNNTANGLSVSHKFSAPGAYSISVSVSDGVGNTVTKSLPQTVNASATPAAPTGLTATAVKASYVTLTWNASTGAGTYNIYRSSAGGSYMDIGSTQGLTYTDSTVQPNVTYAYKVSAVNGCGSEGPLSALISVTTPTLVQFDVTPDVSNPVVNVVTNTIANLGSGTTLAVTVTPHTGFSQAVTLNLTGLPVDQTGKQAVSYYFYDPVPPSGGPVVGQTNQSFNLGVLSQPRTIILTLWLTSSNILAGNSSLQLSGMSGSQTANAIPSLTLSIGSFPLSSSTAVSNNNQAYHPITPGTTASSTGPYHKVESAYIFNEFASYITLPATDHNSVSLVNPYSADAAFVYTGGTARGANNQFYALDMGFQLGHTGNRGWALIGQASTGPVQFASYWIVPDQKIQVQLAAPNAPGFVAGDNYVTFIVTGHILNYDGTPGPPYIYNTVYSSGWTSTSANSFKRVVSIGQILGQNPYDGPATSWPTASDPLGFYASGSFLKNATWTAATLFNPSHPNGIIWDASGPYPDGILTDKCGSYPAAPFVVWSPNGSLVDTDTTSIFTVK